MKVITETCPVLCTKFYIYVFTNNRQTKGIGQGQPNPVQISLFRVQE